MADNQIQVPMANIPDNKKTSARILSYLALGGIGLVVWYKLLPYLKTLVWDSTEVFVGGVLLFALCLLVFNPKFWRALRYFMEALAQFALGWAIEMNPFNVLRMQLDQALKDSQKLYTYSTQLTGKAAEIKEKLEENDKELANAMSKRSLLEKQLRLNPKDATAQANLAEVVSTIGSDADYAKTVKPTYDNLLNLGTVLQRAYDASVLKIKVARKDLDKKQDAYDIATTGAKAMQKAWQALNGRDDLNSDADKALAYLKKDIGAKVGAIQAGVRITSTYLDGKDLDDASKLQTALTELNNIDLTSTNYSDTIHADDSTIVAQPAGNKYLDILNTTNGK